MVKYLGEKYKLGTCLKMLQQKHSVIQLKQNN